MGTAITAASNANGTCGTIRGTLWHILNAEHHFLAAFQGHPDAGNIDPISASGEESDAAVVMA